LDGHPETHQTLSFEDELRLSPTLENSAREKEERLLASSVLQKRGEEKRREELLASLLEETREEERRELSWSRHDLKRKRRREEHSWPR